MGRRARPPRKPKPSLQDLVRPPKLPILSLQRLEPLPFIGGQTGPLALVDLDPAHPLAHRLRRRPEFVSDRTEITAVLAAIGVWLRLARKAKEGGI